MRRWLVLSLLGCAPDMSGTRNGEIVRLEKNRLLSLVDSPFPDSSRFSRIGKLSGSYSPVFPARPIGAGNGEARRGLSGYPKPAILYQNKPVIL
jgi:hypothetical protein